MRQFFCTFTKKMTYISINDYMCQNFDLFVNYSLVNSPSINSKLEDFLVGLSKI
jgi:hypothetical protein